MCSAAEAGAGPPSRVGPRAGEAPSSLFHRPAILWLLVVIALVQAYPLADIRDAVTQLRVGDTDDAMRLVAVRDLVSGQGWFDTVQHRFLPPEGVRSHWSRLIDAPLAALQILLAPVLGRPFAEGLSAVLWPAALLVLNGWLLLAALRPRFGGPAAILAVFAATVSWSVTAQFAPGRVDHHNVQLLLVLGIGLRLMRDGWRAGAGAGLLAALSLAVGLETLPCLAMAGLFLVTRWAWLGRGALPALAGFGCALGLAAPLLFGLQTPPALWAATYCDALSPPWLWLCVAGAACAGACAALDRHLDGRSARFRLAAALGLGVAAGFAALFPACLGGPFAGMPDRVRQDWLLQVTEMQSLAGLLAGGQWRLPAAYWPAMLAAALAATLLAIRSREHRRFFGVSALFLWPGVLGGAFQLRGVYPAAGFLPLVAGPVILGALERALDGTRGWRGRLAGAALVCTLNGHAWVALAALAPAGAAATGERRGEPVRDCAAPAIVAPLDSLPAGTVLAPIDIGPAILLYTHHAVVAAPYHRASRGLVAALEGLGGTEADLRRQIAATGATYLALCRGPLPEATREGTAQAFAAALLRGADPPAWLEPVAMPAGALSVWRIGGRDR
ncbi:hypothetical protein [Methylobacterium nigriterrae]|uniref:hypothetical protein n=1 Tax=Methylobacterium nigriterrae TaxID=3127512 RepID=UPI003013D32F